MTTYVNKTTKLTRIRGRDTRKGCRKTLDSAKPLSKTRVFLRQTDSGYRILYAGVVTCKARTVKPLSLPRQPCFTSRVKTRNEAALESAGDSFASQVL